MYVCTVVVLFHCKNWLCCIVFINKSWSHAYAMHMSIRIAMSFAPKMQLPKCTQQITVQHHTHKPKTPTINAQGKPNQSNPQHILKPNPRKKLRLNWNCETHKFAGANPNIIDGALGLNLMVNEIGIPQLVFCASCAPKRGPFFVSFWRSWLYCATYPYCVMYLYVLLLLQNIFEHW